jgi:phage shock protein A
MGIFSRMLRLCKADVHGVMDQLEDKSLLLKQYLREMEASLKAKETRLAKITQTCRQIQRDLSQRHEEIQKLEKDLELAIRSEKDDIAKMLIRKRRTLEGACEQLAHQIENLTEEQNHLSETLAQQRLKYDQLKLKTAAFSQQAEQCVFEKAVATDASYGWKAPTEEEIELELFQRKEALQQGGAS